MNHLIKKVHTEIEIVPAGEVVDAEGNGAERERAPGVRINCVEQAILDGRNVLPGPVSIVPEQGENRPGVRDDEEPIRRTGAEQIFDQPFPLFGCAFAQVLDNGNRSAIDRDVLAFFKAVLKWIVRIKSAKGADYLQGQRGLAVSRVPREDDVPAVVVLQLREDLVGEGMVNAKLLEERIPGL